MGTIVNLPPQRRRRSASVRPSDEATILLFMGVRYVRDHEPVAPKERPQATETRVEAALELA